MKNTKTLPSMGTYPWQQEMFLRFSDTDAVGHVNNVAVFRYHDNAAMAFIGQALGAPAPAGPGQRWALLRQDVSLDAEIFYPDPLTLCAAVSSIQSHWLSLSLAIFQSGACTGTSTAVVALLNPDNQALPLPAALGEQLQAFMANQA
jgi:acyl-CoA thioester hydrolase